MAGRKTKFNDEICEIILLARESGASLKTCAEYAEIHRTTLQNWINEGKKAKSGKKKKFYLKWKKATAKFKIHHIQNIQNHSNSDWRASQYLLQVTDPNEFVIEKRVSSKNEQNVKLDNVESVADAITRSLQKD